MANTAIVVLLLSALVWLIFVYPETIFYVGFATTPSPPGAVEKIDLQLEPGVSTVVVRFPSNDQVMCEGDLYMPSSNSKYANDKGEVPGIVMAHGIGSTRDMGLWKYARQFVNEGFAVLVFDYRTYGTSDGTPRHWLSPSRHVEDFLSALKYMQSRKDVDATRMGLWGTRYE